MIGGERVLAVIPARGGSKGVPGKNIRRAGGKPLIAWTIDAARASASLDRIILSSDDPAIIAAAQDLGCDAPFVRDPQLADDGTPTIDVVLDALQRCPGHEWVVLLQPTSPLRTGLDIERAVERCVELKAPACVSVCRAQESPYWMYTLTETAHLAPLLPVPRLVRRQDLPPVHVLNGAIYIANSAWLARTRSFVTEDTVAYEMPVERSLDIDTETDFRQLQIILGDMQHVSLSATP